MALAARASNGPMRVRLICARRDHAKRAGGCAPCGKRDEPPRSSARRASQGDACARHLAAGSGDRIGWKLVERPICHHGRVAGGALYRNAAGSERSRGELRPPEPVSRLGRPDWGTRRAARYDGRASLRAASCGNRVMLIAASQRRPATTRLHKRRRRAGPRTRPRPGWRS